MRAVIFLLTIVINHSLLTCQVIDLTGFPKLGYKESIKNIPKNPIYKLYIDQQSINNKGQYETTNEYNDRVIKANQELEKKKFKITIYLIDNYYDPDSAAYNIQLPEKAEKLVIEFKKQKMTTQRWIDIELGGLKDSPPVEPVEWDSVTKNYFKDTIKYVEYINKYKEDLEIFELHKKYKGFRNIKFNYNRDEARKVPYLYVEVVFSIKSYSDIYFTFQDADDVAFSDDNKTMSLTDNLDISLWKLFEINVYAGNTKKLLHSIKY